MYNSRPDDHYTPGSWNVFFFGYKKKLSARFTCPKCERTMSLISNKINDDGTVVNPVLCPYPDCDFKDMVKLLAWDPKAWEPEEGSF